MLSFCYAAQAGSNTQSSCLSFPSARLRLHHHTPLCLRRILEVELDSRHHHSLKLLITGLVWLTGTMWRDDKGSNHRITNHFSEEAFLQTIDLGKDSGG